MIDILAMTRWSLETSMQIKKGEPNDTNSPLSNKSELPIDNMHL